MVVILFGPPAAGKGTQAFNITALLGAVHISTGEILRKNIKEKTPLGLIADSFIAKGNLVPDDLIISLMREKVKEPHLQKGFLLDGFPRTLNQAKQLDTFAEVDKVIDLNVSRETLIKRVTGRRVCGVCGKNYHASTYYLSTCTCGGSLFVRDDDTEDTFVTRLDNYENLTMPIRDYYCAQDKLVTVDGEGTQAEVFERIKQALKNSQLLSKLDS